MPVPTSKAAADQRRLQKEFWRLKQELNATSAQDQFAKWAKLDRKFNEVVAQLEKTSKKCHPCCAVISMLIVITESSLDQARTKFDRYVSTLQWLGTNGLRFFLQWWYTKEAVFWLPHGMVPYYAEWLLSFPRAPLGSISIQAWFIACAAVILLVSDALIAMIGLTREKTTSGQQKVRMEPMKATGEKPTSKGATTDSKKEL